MAQANERTTRAAFSPGGDTLSFTVFSQAAEELDLAADLIDVLLLKLKKLTEMRRFMLQELKAIEGQNADLLLLVLNQRQALMEQVMAIDLDFRHLKSLVARRYYLDDLDFDALLSLLPPDQAEYLRQANNNLLSIARSLSRLGEEIQALLARQQLQNLANPAGAAPDWTEHPVYQYFFTFSAGEPRLRQARRAGG